MINPESFKDTPEKLVIKVLDRSVEQSNETKPEYTRVAMKALVLDVIQTASGLKAGETIDIEYVQDHEGGERQRQKIEAEVAGDRGWAGPQALYNPDPPQIGATCIAYLIKSGDRPDERVYALGAHQYSFENTAEAKAEETIVGVTPSDNTSMGSQSAETLYAECDGTPFYVEGLCPDESCVEPGLERKIYDIWKQRFMKIHRLSPETFAERILVSDVRMDYGPKYVFWRVDYVFRLDWVRSRQDETVNLGKYPLGGEPDDGQLEKSVDLAIEEAEQFDLAGVVPLSAVVSAFGTCGRRIAADWCHIDFENVSGRLLVHAKTKKSLGSQLPRKGITQSSQGIRPPWLGAPSPRCIRASVDLATGELAECLNNPCWIY